MKDPVVEAICKAIRTAENDLHKAKTLKEKNLHKGKINGLKLALAFVFADNKNFGNTYNTRNFDKGEQAYADYKRSNS